MSLDVRLLEKIHELAGGIVQARCPACAEAGGDQAGEHLRVYADGRFGCCVHPKDHEHRKRIFALAGNREVRAFRVNVPSAKQVAPARSVTASLTGLIGTLGTAIPKLISSQPSAQANSGTLGTPILMSRAYAKENDHFKDDDTLTYIDIETGVPSVPITPPSERGPFLTGDGTLVIPFDSSARYQWWKGGQTVGETRKEILSAVAAIQTTAN